VCPLDLCALCMWLWLLHGIDQIQLITQLFIHNTNFMKFSIRERNIEYVTNGSKTAVTDVIGFFFIWFVRILALRPLLAYCNRLSICITR
jgi:hypothetical protein